MPHYSPPLHQPAISRDYLKIPVSANVPLTSLGSPQVAIVHGVGTAPAAADWKSALLMGSELWVLIGAGGDFVLEAGKNYTVWARFTANPEMPARDLVVIRAY